MRIPLLTLGLTVVFTLAGSASNGDAVLLIGDGNSSDTTILQSVLEARGDTVTVGPTYNSFTGGNLAGYNDVLLVPGANAWSMGDMPVSGQQALLNYVKAGGGLVTGESLVQVNSIPTLNYFQTLSAAIPANDSPVATSNNPITFTALTNVAAINANLPSSFSFSTGNGYYSEVYFTPKAGAVGFFGTDQWTSTFGGYSTGYGVVGWNYGSGRVLSFSTYLNSTSLSNTNFATLVGNAINWAAGQGPGIGITLGPDPPIAPGSLNPVPEPAAFLVWGAGALGLAAACSRRRQLRRA